MSTLFYNADEVFEMAIQIEKNGERFYAQGAQGIADARAKEMLLKLKDMEMGHQKLFSELREKFNSRSPKSAIFDPDNEVGKYLQAAADSHVFNSQSSVGTGQQATAKEIMDTAIRFEKDSILFFLGMKDMVPKELGKESVERLIEEEKKHILFIKETMGHLVEKK